MMMASDRVIPFSRFTRGVVICSVESNFYARRSGRNRTRLGDSFLCSIPKDLT